MATTSGSSMMGVVKTAIKSGTFQPWSTCWPNERNDLQFDVQLGQVVEQDEADQLSSSSPRHKRIRAQTRRSGGRTSPGTPLPFEILTVDVRQGDALYSFWKRAVHEDGIPIVDFNRWRGSRRHSRWLANVESFVPLLRVHLEAKVVHPGSL